MWGVRGSAGRRPESRGFRARLVRFVATPAIALLSLALAESAGCEEHRIPFEPRADIGGGILKRSIVQYRAARDREGFVSAPWLGHYRYTSLEMISSGEQGDSLELSRSYVTHQHVVPLGETREAAPNGPLRAGTYRLTTDPSGQSVVTLDGVRVVGDEARAVIDFLTGEAASDRLGRFIAARAWREGEPVRIDDLELCAMLGGAGAVLELTLVRWTSRWGRDVAQFSLVEEGSSGFSSSLWIDGRTGRLLTATRLAATPELPAEPSADGSMRVLSAASQTVLLHPGIQLFKRSYAIGPVGFPAQVGAEVLDVELSRDGSKLIVLERVRPGGVGRAVSRVGLVDVGTRRATTLVSAGVATKLAVPESGDTFSILQDAEGAGQSLQFLIAGDVASRLLGPSTTGNFRDPEITAMGRIGHYSLFGRESGAVVVSNVGYDETIGPWQVSEEPIVFVSGHGPTRRLYSLDTSGALRVHDLEVDASSCGKDETYPLDSHCQGLEMSLGPAVVEAALVPPGCARRAATALAISPDGGRLLHPAWSSDCTRATGVVERSLADLRRIGSYEGTLGAYSLEGHHVVTDHGIFDAGSGEELTRLEAVPELDEVRRVLATSENDVVVVWSGDRALRVYDFDSGVHLDALGRDEIGSQAVLLHHLHGSSLYTLFHSGLLLEEDVETGETRFIHVVRDPDAIGPLPGGRARVGFAYLMEAEFVGASEEGVALTFTTLGTEGTTRYLALLSNGTLRTTVVPTPAGIAEPHAWFVGMAGALLRSGRALTYFGGGPHGDEVVRAELPADPRPIRGLALGTGRLARRVLVARVPEQRDESGRIIVYALEEDRLTEEKVLDFGVAQKWHDPLAWALSPDGTEIAVSGLRPEPGSHFNAAGTLTRIFDVDSGELRLQVFDDWARVDRLIYHPAGDHLVRLTEGGDIHVLDTELGVRVGTVRSAHVGEITGAAWVNGDRLLTRGRDGASRLWNLDSIDVSSFFLAGLANTTFGSLARGAPGSLEMSLVDAKVSASSTGGTFFFTPDGYYAGDKSRLEDLQFLADGEIADFAAFDPWLNRPDVVFDRLGMVSRERARDLRRLFEKRQRVLGLRGDTAFWERERPTLAVRVTGPRVTDSGRSRLHISASDATGLRHIEVSINGVLVERIGATGHTFEQDVELELARHLNEVRVTAYNASGLASRVARERLTGTQSYRGDSTYLVAMGVSEYADPGLTLAYAAKDARDLAEQLRTEPRTQALVLTDAEVTADALPRVRAFLAQAGPDDRVILFLAGHGILTEQADYYFGAYDVDPLSPEKRGVTFAEIESLFDDTASLNRLLLMDTCHAGELDPEIQNVEITRSGAVVRGTRTRGLKAKPVAGRSPRRLGLDAGFALMREQFAALNNRSGLAVIAASSGLQFSLEDARWNNGVFTHAVLEALATKSADLDRDGRILVSELRAHVRNRVVELTQGQQTPTFREQMLRLDFEVAPGRF